MQTKLTLRLDDHLINRAKQHAKTRGTSLSQLVANYFLLLDSDPKIETDLPPTTHALAGILKGAAVDQDDYRDYLEQKHA